MPIKFKNLMYLVSKMYLFVEFYKYIHFKLHVGRTRNLLLQQEMPLDKEFSLKEKQQRLRMLLNDIHNLGMVRYCIAILCKISYEFRIVFFNKSWV